MGQYRVIMAVGGTGGHLYPAMSLAQELINAGNISVTFVGKGLGESPYFNSRQFDFVDISSSTITPRRIDRVPRQVYQVGKGIKECRHIIRDYRPHLVIGFGSYYSLPMILAARLSRIPYILHEQNAIPGKVNRWFSGGALLTGIYFSECSSRLSGDSKRARMPFRSDFVTGKMSREEACHFYGLDPSKPIVLVFGGSQGALAINAAFMGSATYPFQILHFTGDQKMADKLKKHYQSKAVVRVREDLMALAWSAADLVVSRAGAGTISEMIEMEVPGILIPYPYSADKHQDKNGEVLERVIKGGVVWNESELEKKNIVKEIEDILDGDRLNVFRENLRCYKARDTSGPFSAIILETLEAVS